MICFIKVEVTRSYRVFPSSCHSFLASRYTNIIIFTNSCHSFIASKYTSIIIFTNSCHSFLASRCTQTLLKHYYTPKQASRYTSIIIFTNSCHSFLAARYTNIIKTLLHSQTSLQVHKHYYIHKELPQLSSFQVQTHYKNIITLKGQTEALRVRLKLNVSTSVIETITICNYINM